ncbi:ParB/Srx family N-terminal domain-containing protein [Mesorhizobium sp.]|uniref:ParB/Srx family N-terminal domain-containing protein n=1 Tax=Mesorhizobium sp. TaxID=1871066 RepID=UPI000FE72353|nr:ParB/Srx family N-terminal domain-containing protein [Mesorhizobium sp.]RWI35407.1 MAG: chromosome partitioning protein ParB [Mesorhizobium sp.]RWJ66424.1 MAG: chromosome partitioning protein ParB [Mesorhizobium sp.]
MTTEPHKIEIWDIDKIIPYEANAKKHPDDQVTKLAKAIESFGWTQPIVVWTNGEIIAGHGRRLAALKLGKTKVPVIVRSDLTKAQADALRLSDNRVTSTDYDMSMIQDELQRLAAEDFDIEVIGFDERELEFATADLGAISDDMFVTDISQAVEQQKADNASAAEATDDIAAPVADALGFKRVTVAQSREIRELMGKVQARTGKSGVDALILVLSAAV